VGFVSCCSLPLRFCSPRILDSQPVKEKIRAFLLAKTNENVAFRREKVFYLKYVGAGKGMTE
jgi:hypothetical protein